jgi:mannosyltransferase OCH1-like enzyme
MPQPFAYWHQKNRIPTAPFTEHWQALFAGFRTFDDDDVLPLLQARFPSAVPLYQALSIPAARADVARLLLLHTHGGMYVGSHLGAEDAGKLESVLSMLDRYEGVLAERSPRLPELGSGQRSLVNMVMVARPDSSWLLDVCEVALANLATQRELEQAGGYVPYNIWLLTGPGALTKTLSNPAWTALLPAYADRVAVVSERDLGLRREQFRPNTGEPHWSQRQLTEPLFAPAPDVDGCGTGSVRL